MSKIIIGIFILALIFSLSIFGNATLINILDPETPEVPTITGQSTGKLGQKYYYNITTTDPQDDDIYFNIRCSDCNAIFNSEWFKSGEKYMFSHCWSCFYQLSNPFYIRAKAIDSKGYESDWGEFQVIISNVKDKSFPFIPKFSIQAISTDDQSPSAPIITGPCKAELDQICNYTIVSIDPQGDNIFYEIRYSDIPNLIIEYGPYFSGVSVTVSHYWWTYYQNCNPFCIRVRARDIDGHTSDWSICQTNITSLDKIKNITYIDIIPMFLQRFLQRFPFIERILSQIL
jgi:hypothetical protein